jgi:hypothetical protein
MSQQGPANHPKSHDAHQFSVRMIFFLTSEKTTIHVRPQKKATMRNPFKQHIEALSGDTPPGRLCV